MRDKQRPRSFCIIILKEKKITEDCKSPQYYYTFCIGLSEGFFFLTEATFLGIWKGPSSTAQKKNETLLALIAVANPGGYHFATPVA
jgi:hypothetical protein